MKKILWIGDACCPSGFAKATHGILDTLRHHFEIVVLGINHRGDPHPYPYQVWAAAPGGDAMGVQRMGWMIDVHKPDLIVIQNDPWNFPGYLKPLKKIDDFKNIPVIGIAAVDGKNIGGSWFDGLDTTIFWTKFAQAEAVRGDFKGRSYVIPLGVDQEIYKPMDKYEARLRLLTRNQDDAFIVGNVNRNQPRKRWDLTIKYFGEWIRAKQIRDAWLFLHVAPTGDTGIEVKQLAKYYGCLDRLILMEPEVFYGCTEEHMAVTYNCFDVQISTTQGEGFGLTTLEGMACGIPQIVPDWSALGDWAAGAVWLVPCPQTNIGPPYVNVIGGVPDQSNFTMALQRLYADKEARLQNAAAALERASEPRYRWGNVGREYLKVINEVVGG